MSQGDPAELNQKLKNKDGDESSLVRWGDSALDSKQELKV